MFGAHSKFAQALVGFCGAALAFGVPGISLAQGATPTQTTLSLSSSSVQPGAAVTLTANVTSGGTAVYPGQILFCNADAPHCQDVAIIGTAQLTAAGTAVIHMRFGTGNHNIKAFFTGTTRTAVAIPNAGPPRLPSTSPTQTVTVESAGTVPTTTTLTASGNAGSFQLTSTVTTPARPVAGGTVAFTNGGTTLGSVPLSAGASSLQLTPKSSPGDTGDQIFRSVSGDFNNDGIPDLALSYFDKTFLTILLGKGDGTFSAQPNASIGHSGGGLVTADFNGDGILDIAAGSLLGCCSVSILLGNGDGTFTPQSSISAGSQSNELLAIDFNGDGILDLAVVSGGYNNGDNTVTIALGNGDGTFTPSTTLKPPIGPTGSFSSSPHALASADFNGDGIPDLALGTNARLPGATDKGALYVFFGTGDGTFTTTSMISAALGFVDSVASADFNGDGLSDLVVYDGNTHVVTLLGDGKGGFHALTPFYLQNYARSLVVNDFNGDGIADLALAGVERDLPILFGKGNGGFSEADNFVETNGYSIQSFSIADFDGDGVPDFAVNILLQNATDVVLSIPARTVPLEFPSPSGGSYQIVASYSGDSLYQPSASASSTVESVTAPPVISPSGDSYIFPFKVTLTDTTPGAVITYTIDPYGEDGPPGQPTRYTGPFEIPAAYTSFGHVEVLATATAPGYLESRQTWSYYELATPTVTTLEIAPGDSVPEGTLVTLSAHVTANGVPFRGGIVSFCNAATRNCEDNILGSATLHGGDLASVRLLLAAGSYSIRAFYHEVTQYPPNIGPFLGYGISFSEPQTLVVRGKSATTASAVVTQQTDNSYQLSSSVAVFGRRTIAGTLRFNDSVNGGAPTLLGSTVLSPSGTAIAFAAAAPVSTGQKPLSLAVADFNHDGLPDIVTADTGENALATFIGDGQGTFSLQEKLPLFATPTIVATGDLNGDGVPDIVVAYRSISSVAVLLGNSDGSFTEKTILATPSDAAGLVITDMNGDGVLDIATANTTSSTVSIFYGAGDGTFGNPTNQHYNIQLHAQPISIATGDLNGDGLADLVTSNSDGTVSVLLAGNSFGQYLNSFGIPDILNPGGSGPIALADFNGDSIPDLAVPSATGIAIYLGNGDGTFASKASLYGSGVQTLNTADFDGDGITDLAITETIGKQAAVVVYFGAGDGTFPISTRPKTTSFHTSTVISDFNGDGIPDLVATDPDSNAFGTLLGTQVTIGTIQGINLVPGTHVITSTYLGSTSLDPSNGPPVTITVPAPVQ